MIKIECPVCHMDIEIDEIIHLLDDQIRTEYCDICENIIEIKNREVIEKN